MGKVSTILDLPKNVSQIIIVFSNSETIYIQNLLDEELDFTVCGKRGEIIDGGLFDAEYDSCTTETIIDLIEEYGFGKSDMLLILYDNDADKIIEKIENVDNSMSEYARSISELKQVR